MKLRLAALGVAIAVVGAPAAPLAAKRKPKQPLEYRSLRPGMSRSEVGKMRKLTCGGCARCKEEDEFGLAVCEAYPEDGEEKVVAKFVDGKLAILRIDYAADFKTAHEAVVSELARKFGAPDLTDTWMPKEAHRFEARDFSPNNRSVWRREGQGMILVSIAGCDGDYCGATERSDHAFRIVLVESALRKLPAQRRDTARRFSAGQSLTHLPALS